MECGVVREEPVQLGSGEAVASAGRAANLGIDNRWKKFKWETNHQLVLMATERLSGTSFALRGLNPVGQSS